MTISEVVNIVDFGLTLFDASSAPGFMISYSQLDIVVASPIV